MIFNMGKHNKEEEPVRMLPSLGKRSGIPSGTKDISDIHNNTLKRIAEEFKLDPGAAARVGSAADLLDPATAKKARLREMAEKRRESEASSWRSQQLQQQLSPSVDPNQLEEQRVIAALQNGAIDAKLAFQALGLDYEKEAARLAIENAKQRARKVRKQQRIKAGNEAFSRLEPFFEKWMSRGGTGWFKRGDVARILKVTPKRAGQLLQLAVEGHSLVLREEGGWWHISQHNVKSKKIFNSTVSQAMNKLPASTQQARRNFVNQATRQWQKQEASRYRPSTSSVRGIRADSINLDEVQGWLK